MKLKEFFRKITDRFVWGNLLAMAVVVVLLCIGVKYGLDIYTHHGQEIAVPGLRGMDFNKARALVEGQMMRIAVSDTGHNKAMADGSILIQNPESGSKVKQGHTIYVTINSTTSPIRTIPDLIDNTSVRQAEAELLAMGFRLTAPKLITGEKDWLYGITAGGRQLNTGDRISTDSMLTLVVGNGTFDDEMSIDFVETDATMEGEGDVDEFEEVAGPPAAEAGAGSPTH